MTPVLKVNQESSSRTELNVDSVEDRTTIDQSQFPVSQEQNSSNVSFKRQRVQDRLLSAQVSNHTEKKKHDIAYMKNKCRSPIT